VKGFQISDDGPQLRLLPDNNILRSNLPVGEKKTIFCAATCLLEKKKTIF